jgi:hypothetical protein
VAWGIGWGLLVVFVVGLFISYVVLQETRAQRHWRRLVEAGDMGAIRQILEAEVERWRTERMPKGVEAALWHGVQTVELVEVGAGFARVSCSAEGQYALVDGERREVSSALQEGMRLTVKLADMLLYDIPNLRLAQVHVDVYTTFREATGGASQRCILSTPVRRSEVEDLDWDNTPPEEIVARLGGRFQADAHGAPQPIEPLEVAAEQREPGG